MHLSTSSSRPAVVPTAVRSGSSTPALRRAFFVSALLVLFFVGDRLLAWGLERLLLSSEFRYSRVYAGRAKADIVILGNSHAVNAFFAPEIERLTGQNALNLGYNGLSARLAEVIFSDYLERNAAPKLLIIEPSCVSGENRVIKQFKLYTGQSARLRAAFRELDWNQAVVTELLHAYRYNNEMFHRSLFYLGRSDNDWVNRYRFNPEVLTTLDRSRDAASRWPMPSKEQLDALCRMISLAKSHGIGVRVVFSPHHPAVVEGVEEFERWRKAVLDGLPPDVAVHDFSNRLRENALFADLGHINYEGNLILTPFLLKERVLLP